MPTGRVRVIGGGRAGGALAGALDACGWQVAGVLGRTDDPTGAAQGVDLLVIATPDAVIAAVAAAVAPDPGAVVVHLSGSLGLDVLAPHPRRAGLHPLVSLPDATRGAAALRSGATFALAEGGDPLAAAVVEQFGGRALVVADADRAAYHAAACVAANHLVAVLGQAERIAALAGVPLDAFADLARGALENAFAIGPAAALTGPAARGDWPTVRRHLAALDAAALDAGERAWYLAGVHAARFLAAPDDPPPTDLVRATP